MIAPRGLDGALDGLGAGVGEEHLVGERQRAQFRRQRLLLGNAKEVGDVPQLAGLLGERGDERGMGVAEGIDGDATGKIEQPASVGGLDPGALAARERDRGAREGLVER